MIFRLMSEQKDEDDHKNWCDLETEKSTESKDDKDEKIEMFKKKISEHDAAIKLLVKKIAENNDKAAVTSAIQVLKDFYKESGMIAKEPWEFVQIRSHRDVELPKSPDTWGSSYTGVTDPESGSDGVLSILDGVATKFATMESDAKLQDSTDQKDYDQDMAAKKVEIADIKSDSQMKDAKEQGLQEKLDALSSKLKSTSKENDAVLQYLKDLKPACAPGEGSYEDRKQARADEIQALRKAQVILEDAFRAKA